MFVHVCFVCVCVFDRLAGAGGIRHDLAHLRHLRCVTLLLNCCYTVVTLSSHCRPTAVKLLLSCSFELVATVMIWRTYGGTRVYDKNAKSFVTKSRK
jgi:hypothetical protein